MSVLNANKVVDKANIICGQTAKVTISFDSISSLRENPEDILLLVDSSSSMFGDKINYAKIGLCNLINIVASSSFGIKNKLIFNGSKIGLISFSDEIKETTSLNENIENLIKVIDKISIGGKTNHSLAFKKAIEFFNYDTLNEKIIILFSDGITTEGVPASKYVSILKEMGIKIYCIGTTTDSSNLRNWATCDNDSFVKVSNNPKELEDMFTTLGYDVAKVGARNVKIIEKLEKDFYIKSIDKPLIGTIVMPDNNTIIWNIDATGIPKDTPVLSFNMSYKGFNKDRLNVYFNDSITYSDFDNNKLVFPKPTINIKSKDEEILFDKEFDFVIDECQVYKDIDIGTVNLNNLGRIVNALITFKNVCPGRLVAVSTILVEKDSFGIEHERGTKVFLIKSNENSKCEDITRKVTFPLPEELSFNENKNVLCSKRNLSIKVIANYVDNNEELLFKDAIINN